MSELPHRAVWQRRIVTHRPQRLDILGRQLKHLVAEIDFYLARASHLRELLNRNLRFEELGRTAFTPGFLRGKQECVA